VEGETEFGLIQTKKSVEKKLKLPTFLAARPEKIDVEPTRNHDQMSSMILRALKPSGAGRYYIDFVTATERYRQKACPERRDQTVQPIRWAVVKCQGREMAGQ